MFGALGKHKTLKKKKHAPTLCFDAGSADVRLRKLSRTHHPVADLTGLWLLLVVFFVVEKKPKPGVFCF